MDFTFTKEQEALRKEIHDFFVDELPSDIRPSLLVTKKQLEFMMELQKKAGKKRYLAPGWGKESGGLGLSDMEQGIIMEETGYWGIKWPGGQGLKVCGPPVHLFGTEEQKKKFLPGIASGEAIWYQAFTEPGAGSDEANVALEAKQDGDYFILNGQKTFITGPAPADYLYTLVRTQDVSPKHRGLSLFLVDAKAPGITYGSLTCMSVFTVDIFFKDVKVHKDRLLGELNRGFYHAMATFMFERSGTVDAGANQRFLEEFVQFCKETKRNGRPLIEDPEAREVLADLVIEAEIEKLCAWHGQWFFAEREKLGPQPYNLSALFMKTFYPKRAELMMKMFGLYGQLKKTAKHAKYEGMVDRRWQMSRSTHPAGTVEINKVIISQRGLGLPRAARPTGEKKEG